MMCMNNLNEIIFFLIFSNGDNTYLIYIRGVLLTREITCFDDLLVRGCMVGGPVIAPNLSSHHRGSHPCLTLGTIHRPNAYAQALSVVERDRAIRYAHQAAERI